MTGSAVRTAALTKHYGRLVALDAGAPRWVLDLSPYARLAAVPFAPPHWAATGVMTLLPAVGAALGARRFRTRDLRG